VLDKHPDVVARLAKAADTYAAHQPETGGITEMAGRQSELFGALGYLSLDVHSRKPSRDAPHPRDMVSILDILAQAQSAYLQMEYDRALPLYEECIRLSPGSAMFHDFAGKTRLRLNDPAGAVEAFRKALSIQPEMIDTRLALGIALVNTGALAAAEETFQDVIRRSPASHKGYGYLASLYHQQNRPEEELETLESLFRNSGILDADEDRRLRNEIDRLRRVLGKQ
jgi:tetratricopeptide (TPR) repeat protein